ncbi:MAG: hypothetical protein ABIJ33_00790 [Patescibacteria group bacterium]|nr:hypothetical protein [Patescibacteria group bacterium]
MKSKDASPASESLDSNTVDISQIGPHSKDVLYLVSKIEETLYYVSDAAKVSPENTVACLHSIARSLSWLHGGYYSLILAGTDDLQRQVYFALIQDISRLFTIIHTYILEYQA